MGSKVFNIRVIHVHKIVLMLLILLNTFKKLCAFSLTYVYFKINQVYEMEKFQIV